MGRLSYLQQRLHPSNHGTYPPSSYVWQNPFMPYFTTKTKSLHSRDFLNAHTAFSRPYFHADLKQAATQDFTENFPDPAAAMFATLEILASNLDQFATVFFFYDGPVVPSGVFDKFLALPFSSDTTAVQPYSSLVSSITSCMRL